MAHQGVAGEPDPPHSYHHPVIENVDHLFEVLQERGGGARGEEEKKREEEEGKKSVCVCCLCVYACVCCVCMHVCVVCVCMHVKGEGEQGIVCGKSWGEPTYIGIICLARLETEGETADKLLPELGNVGR